ncbi:transcriptional regulator [Pantoea sp. Bo_2]|uniref:Cro/CI family transcriptional regulator n=1 Tax=unclassified Pantoea TaxID=2630326 RepID=UPI0012319112|nr:MULTISPECIES: Cro/CI family transcriptional regulator [unclassified Pantoea]KAA5936463.1 transcriptional regulator [Pantoea sp. VH_3]KAA5949717.1 transcriptional regulator [Pantoea sp. VH_25]KAA5955504.1 transcriptional regulator [Pantoea sp. VH_24]KAA5959054.1 transcriptional regulator [Pantoea sp. VH_16]KAA5964251.1 transcriptional regulator [Pantoea sp. VH_18]
MYTKDALNYFGGSKSRLAAAAGVKTPSVYKWGTLVPEGRAARLQSASNGVLIYDTSIYDAHSKFKRNGDPIYENQTRAHP